MTEFLFLGEFTLIDNSTHRSCFKNKKQKKNIFYLNGPFPLKVPHYKCGHLFPWHSRNNLNNMDIRT